MSAPIRSSIASASRIASSSARTIHSSTVTRAAAAAAAASSGSDAPATPTRSTSRRKPLGAWDIRHLQDFAFDDATSLGFMRLEKLREVQELITRVEADREALGSQQQSFTPPTSPIRISQTIDLSRPSSPIHNKRVLFAPVSRLPLKNADAIKRFKLIAGPRWSAVTSDAKSQEAQGKEGWIKISEERFPDGRMNRLRVVDVLDKLVAAANDPNSPISASTPLDNRAQLARDRKSSKLERVWKRAQAMQARSEVVGGVKGFPKEWLAPSAST